MEFTKRAQGCACLQDYTEDADIPLPNEPIDDRDVHSNDSHDLSDQGSDAEGEDLQEDAERYAVWGLSCVSTLLLFCMSSVDPQPAFSAHDAAEF